MSRHQLTGHNPQHHIVVGWDKGLRTFFGQVLSEAEVDCGDEILWVGTTTGEVRTPEELRLLMSAHALLSDELLAQINSDKES